MTYPANVAAGLIPSCPKTIQTKTIPTSTLAHQPTITHRPGTRRSAVSNSPSFFPSDCDEDPYFILRKASTTNSHATGSNETRLSAHMMANETQRIQPLDPEVISPTGPGAHPENLAIGERIPHPTSIPCAKEVGTGYNKNYEEVTDHVHAKRSRKSHDDSYCSTRRQCRSIEYNCAAYLGLHTTD